MKININMVRRKSLVVRGFLFLMAAAFLAPAVAKAQFNEALLLSQDPLPSGSRGMAMGGSLISAADGVDALEFNPAALVLMPRSDFTLSLMNRGYSSDATFLNTTSDASQSSFTLSSIGIAYKYPTVVGHMTFGVSFDEVQNYTSSYSFSAVNPNSSLFNTQAFLNQPPGYGNGNRNYLLNNNLAYALGLTYDVPDTGAFTLSTPITKGMQESGTVTTSGGLNAVRIGGGVDVAEGVSLGATLNILFGEYDYSRNYTETNVNNVPIASDTTPPANFQSANITDVVHQDQSGYSLKLGLLVKESIVNFGLTLETPQVMHIDETYNEYGTSNFGGSSQYSYSYLPGAESYDVITPLKLGAGASIHALGFTGSASVSYTNLSDLQFENSSVDMTAENQMASDSLRAVLSWQLGAEYKIPGIGIAIRAGFAYEPSPFNGDASSYDTKIISAGLGIPIGRRFEIEAVYRHSSFNTIHNIYQMLEDQTSPGDANITSDAVDVNDVAMTFQYKF
jgi:hypothetical protein